MWLGTQERSDSVGVDLVSEEIELVENVLISVDLEAVGPETLKQGHLLVAVFDLAPGYQVYYTGQQQKRCLGFFN